MIEVSYVIMHERNKPYIFLGLGDAQLLTCEDLAEVYFAFTDTDAAAVSDDGGAIGEGIIHLGQPLIDPC